MAAPVSLPVKATKLIRDQHNYSVDFWYHTESRGKSPWLHPLQPNPTRTRSEPFLDFHFFFLILNLILCYIIKFIFILCLVAEKTRGKKETSVSPLFDQAQQHARVLVEERSSARILTLNRPRQLNALSYQMISRLLELFIAYEEDSTVKLVIVKGKGRAFCAGGDVAAVVRNCSKGDWRFGANYFRKEFLLNYIMATYRKPQVSILNGIVMGGGAGASIHGRFRVATENSIFAMPETGLGLFPDVGASYFLSRLQGFFGEYVGLTGTTLDGAEMLACGLATHFVPSAKLSLLEEALHKLDSSDPDLVSATIDKYSQQPYLKEQSAYHRLDLIDRCFSRRTVEDILSALGREASNKNDGWISATIKSLKGASPTSLKISLRSIREGRLQGVGQCLIREYRMVCHILRGNVSRDFFEGCRAILLDKDKNPKWDPSKLELVSEDMVDSYFSMLDDEDWEDLKFPARSNLPVSARSKL